MDNDAIAWKKVKNEVDSLSDCEKEQIDIMVDLIDVLKKSKYTERELAKITGIKQPAINRLKQSNVESARMITLLKLLMPLGYTLKIEKRKNKF